MKMIRPVLRRLLGERLSAPAEPASLTVETKAGPVEIALRRSPQARRLTLRLKPGTGAVTMTLPARTSLALARDFAERHRGWIETRLAARPQSIAFVDGAVVPVRGVEHVIRHRGGRGLLRVEPGLRGQPPVISVPGEAAHVGRRVHDFLRREAKKDLTAAVARHAAALEVSVLRVSVKDTVSRWGSCSSRGAIAFSWRLIMAPPDVLDYLAAHEVAHRREMNHGPRFWRLTRMLAPHTDAAEAWLKRHGASLHRYTP